MKKTSSRIREEIAKLQDVLKAAETREAERIGRIALKAGLGDIEIEEGLLLRAFDDLAQRFRRSGATYDMGPPTTGRRGHKADERDESAQDSSGTAPGSTGKA